MQIIGKWVQIAGKWSQKNYRKVLTQNNKEFQNPNLTFFQLHWPQEFPVSYNVVQSAVFGHRVPLAF